MPDFVFVKDVNSRFLVANEAIAAAYGMAPDELVGRTDFDLHPPAVAQGFLEFERQVITAGLPIRDMEESFPDSQGVQRWYSTTKIPLRNSSGAVVGLVGVARDITERKQMESLRAQQSSIFELMAKNSPLYSVLNRLVLMGESQLHGISCSILLFDAESSTLRLGAAPSLPHAFNVATDGLTVGPTVGSCGTAAFRRESVVVTDTLLDPLWADYRELARTFGLRSSWSNPILSHDGKVLGTFAMYSREVRSPTTTETGLVDTMTRIAAVAIERQRAEDRIHFLAHHDSLTGLANRTLLTDRLSQAMLHAERQNNSVLVVFVDLDNFKVVNDGLGHIAGDKLLKVTAERMVQSVRASDSVIRLGGDEFVILLTDQAKSAEVLSPILQRLRAAIAEPINIDGHHLRVTSSIGVAVYPLDGGDAESLLKNADAAMYSAKRAGRDGLHFYAEKMNSAVLDRLSLQEHLRQAIEHSQLSLQFQPQVDLRSGRIFAVEALLRWKHPTFGNVSPSKFIPIAEESGLIVPIGDWVLRTACEQNKAWQDAGAEPIVVSVNVSARQLMDSNWTSRVSETLRLSGLEPRYLELELTETMLMADLPRAVAAMQDLTKLGVHLSIDDFGTGYSSLSVLKTFPVCRLKIDQSFVRDIPRDENDKAIASAVISLGQRLGLRVIAEGVETKEQMQFLEENNCDEMQGYLFSEPVSPSKIESLLRSQPPLEEYPALS